MKKQLKKTTQLKKLIENLELGFLMEAHNALSAKIVEEAGFKGIWASSLTISASLGVRDNNEASWTQIVEILEFMSDATTIPILLDGDTGYGDFNSVRRLVKKLEQRGIAGVCIEDKLFPKKNSFISGDTQALADIDEFCGKIRAAKDAQQDPDFVVIARVEALIAGWGMDEAIRRAEAYRKAGADAILIHSKKTTSTDIEEFMKEWGDRHPVVVVPTKYYSTPTDKFREIGVSTIIWANHLLRSSITAIEKTAAQIFEEESIRNVEGQVASVADIFQYQGADELEAAEKKYLPTAGKNVNAVILAASQGEGFGELTKEIPKTLLKVYGKPILQNQIETLNRLGIKDITVVRGFGKDKVSFPGIKTIDDDEFTEGGELHSLYLARQLIGEDTVIGHGDLIVKDYVLNDLLNDKNDITIIVDADYEEDGNYHEFVTTDKPYSIKLFTQSVGLETISANIPSEKRNHGQPFLLGEFLPFCRSTAQPPQ